MWQTDRWKSISGHQRAERGRPEVQWLTFFEKISKNPTPKQSWHEMSPQTRAAYPIISAIIEEMMTHQIDEFPTHVTSLENIQHDMWISYQAGDATARDQFRKIAQSTNWFSSALYLAGWQAVALKLEQAFSNAQGDMAVHEGAMP